MVLTERFGVSERRACRVVGQHRSTQRRCPRPPSSGEAKLRRRLRQIAKTHPRWGWKKAHDVLRREGWTINAKRTRRLWRTEGLKRPVTCRKRRRLHPSTAVRLEATRPNEVWAVDFQFDETADYRRLKLTNIVDEFTREALAMEVNRGSTADDLIDVIEHLVAERGAPGLPAHGQRARADLRGPCGTGADCRARGPSTSSPARPGRTPTSSRSTDACATSCSTSRSSARSPKPGSLSKRGGWSTTPGGHTRPSAGSPRSSSPRDGHRSMKSPAPDIPPRSLQRLTGQRRDRFPTSRCSRWLDRRTGPRHRRRYIPGRDHGLPWLRGLAAGCSVTERTNDDDGWSSVVPWSGWLTSRVFGWITPPDGHKGSGNQVTAAAGASGAAVCDHSPVRRESEGDFAPERRAGVVGSRMAVLCQKVAGCVENPIPPGPALL